MGKSNWKRIAIAVGVTCVVALALGLGLGLGLQSDDPPTTTTTPTTPAPPGECNRRLLYKQDAHMPTQKWTKKCPSEFTCSKGQKSVLMISMDGFRADYLLRNYTPTLSAVKKCGVHAPFMSAVFPTKTFVNHYSMATGLYAESHGIIGNTMYDSDREEMFSLSRETRNDPYYWEGEPGLYPESHGIIDNSMYDFELGRFNKRKPFDNRWWEGEPIWNTVKKNGGKVVTMFWPGTDVAIQDMRPDHCYYYNGSIPFKDRINEVLGHYAEDTIPTFTTLYLEQPDWASHDQGPFGDWVHGNLTIVDSLIDQLLAGLEQQDLLGCVDVIITADHGIQGASCKRKVVLDEYFSSAELANMYVYEGMWGRISGEYVYDPVTGMKPNPGGPEPAEIIDKLRCRYFNETKDWNMVTEMKADLPKRMHYSNHRRIDDVVLDLQDSWMVLKSYQDSRERVCSGGNHGGDNMYESMNAIFMGMGNNLKEDFEVESFQNIELYNLVAALLNLSSVAPNNGTVGRIYDFLKNPGSPPTLAPPVGSYRSWTFPTPEEADLRRNSLASCECADLSAYTSKTAAELDEQLNLSDADVTVSRREHLPYGIPLIDFDDSAVQRLTHAHYISAYSSTYRMPLWTAFKKSHKSGTGSVRDGVFPTAGLVPDSCMRPDVRLTVDDLVECDLYVNATQKITWAKLYPADSQDSVDSQLDAHVSTNLVPMYEGFKDGAWLVTMRLLDEYTEKYGDLHVTMGPVFDYNADGHRDELGDIKNFIGGGQVPVPTHYFVTASRCEGTSACGQPEHLFSMLLPHKHTPSNCWDRRYDRYQREHVARIRDTELLTDLRFHEDIPVAARAVLGTRLTVGLWERLAWVDGFGADGACPTVTQTECPAGYSVDDPPVILISLDGFRADYITRGETPTLRHMYDCGVHAPHMRSIYPSMTFPNHYTQVTGLYPEVHGIIDNSMYDTDLGENFYLGSAAQLKPEWWDGEPIWNTVELQNKTAMAMFWPGSDVEIGGIRPSEWMLYNGYYPYDVRVDTVLDWLNGSTGVRPDFISLYFSRIDEAGHNAGPESMEVDYAMQLVEVRLKELMDGIYRMKLDKCINFIVVSDHGMSDISCDRSVVLRDHLDQNTMDNTYAYNGPSARISNEYNSSNYVYQNIPLDQQVPLEDIMRNLTCESPHMSVYDKTTLPVRHHYKDHYRIDPIVNRMELRWGQDRYTPWCGMIGNHGWDPSYEKMQAFFTAYGPSIKQETVVEPFENIELYNLMSHLLRITPAPNNGTEGSMYNILRSPPDLPASTESDSYSTCPYPATGTQYDSRADLVTAGCTCLVSGNETVVYWDSRLNLTETDMDAYENAHLPYGDIRYTSTGHTPCKLHHEMFVSGYSTQWKLPLWSAFTLSKDQLPDDVTVTSQPSCLRPDVRLEQAEQPLCADYSVDDQLMAGFLHPADFSSDADIQKDSQLLTNSVPMYTNFWTGIWQDVLLALVDWARVFDAVHVVTGPIFDYDGDGLRDTDTSLSPFMNDSVPVPSHYFATVFRCDKPVTCTELYDYTVQSFVLVHLDNITNCMNSHQYMTDNVARLRDIELLTGLEFFTQANNSITEHGLLARLLYPVTLWPQTSP